jgi:hypothetical protein
MRLDHHDALAIFVITLATVLTLVGTLRGAEWVQTVTIVFGALVGGNAVMHTATQFSTTTNKPQP